MPRLSMNELTTFRWSFDEDVLHYANAGYDAIGVWRRKLSDFGEERAVELLDESGLTVSNLLWAGGFTGNDGRSLPESVADARSAIRTAANIRADCLVVYTGGRNNHTQRHANRLVRSAIDEILPVAERCGVTLAIEPMHAACAAEWTFLTDLESTLDLLADYASSSLKMVYDTYHFPLGGEHLDLLPDLAPSIGVVHLGDLHKPHSIDQERCELGTGEAPLGDIISTLLAAGYEGTFDVELMGPMIEANDYQEVLWSSSRAFNRAISAAGVLGG